jgi:hypothetical protein
MTRYMHALNQDPTEWLLEESNPSVRYHTLVWLLGRREDDSEVELARRAVAGSEPVQRLLNAQRPEGYWGRDKRPYHGVSKHLITLEHLGYQGDDERLHRAIEYLFEYAQMDDGAFTSDKYEAGRRGVIPCFTANAVHLLLWFGYGDDKRTAQAVQYLLDTQLEDGGWLCSERAVDLFLDKGLYRHHSEFGKVSNAWFEFARPLFASTDVLEVLGLVAPYVSPEDERLEEELNLVLRKQDQRGRWSAEREIPVRKTFPLAFETVGEPSKWVTLHALVALYRLSV